MARLSVSLSALVALTGVDAAHAQPAQLDTIKAVVEKIYSCWEPPQHVNPKVNVTAIIAFRRDGAILGHPRITYESDQATDNDRLLYRVAIMKALERCTPLSFSERLAGAVAGHPFAIRFGPGRYTPRNKERDAWLTMRIL